MPAIFLAAVCLLVLAFYAWTARPEVRQLSIWRPDQPAGYDPANAYYNLLVKGFRSGQLNLKRETPPGLMKLADPTDPVANASYRVEGGLHDVSYYKGKLYIYFGVTPALVLFWPYAALTGHYLFHKQAVAFFCSVGFLIGVALLGAIRRRYFPEAGRFVVAAGALAVGLATCVPDLLQRPDLWEVPISCAYAMEMLALAGIWRALHDPARRCRWLSAASLAYGLAVGARPNALFGAVILAAPVVHVWRLSPRPGGRRWLEAGRALTAAVVPISLIGIGLMSYNYLRFDSPFEFGQHYQMTGASQGALPQMFSRSYFWFDFRVYFLQPLRWSSTFPFVKGIMVPPSPAGHLGASDFVFGVLPNLPLAWMTLAVPLAWRTRATDDHSALRLFLLAMAVLSGTSLLSLCFYAGIVGRYQVEFVPVLIMLAMCGVLVLERTLAGRSKWLIAVRCGWVSILLVSVLVNLLMSAKIYARERFRDGLGQLHLGRPGEATGCFEEALRVDPDNAMAHYYLAVGLAQTGRLADAVNQYNQALQINPGIPQASGDLQQARYKLGRQAATTAR
jgi:hypothetical protein